MYPHHQQTIERLIAHFSTDSRYVALLIGGSVAKGWAKETSDVDVMFVVTDEEYERRARSFEFTYYTPDFCDYEGGYVDGKFVNVAFMREVADRGSEPARSAFYKAYPAYSHDSQIESLLQQITIYPEAQREHKMRAFYSQVMLLNWYIGEAEKRQDRYLLTRMSADMVLYSGRLLLAYNRVLYPYHKWFMKVLAGVDQKPPQFMEQVSALLAEPSKEKAQLIFDTVSAYQDWGVTLQDAVNNFMRDREWNWREHPAPLEDI